MTPSAVTNAWFPSSLSIGGVKVHPFTLGKYMFLSMIKSPALTNEPVTLAETALALAVMSMPLALTVQQWAAEGGLSRSASFFATAARLTEETTAEVMEHLRRHIDAGFVTAVPARLPAGMEKPERVCSYPTGCGWELTLVDTVLSAYPGAYYCSEPWKIDDEVPCGEDLLDGVPMAKLWTLHATVCERQGLEPNGVQTYAERDWFAARKAARAAASARDEGAQGAPGAAHGKEVPKDAQGNEKGVAGEDAQRDAQAAKEVTGGEVGDAGDDQSKQHVHNDNLPA